MMIGVLRKSIVMMIGWKSKEKCHCDDDWSSQEKHCNDDWWKSKEKCHRDDN